MGRGGDRQISNCSRVLPELLKADASSTAASGPPRREQGRVDVRVGYGHQASAGYSYLIALRAAASGTDVDIRSADQWRPMLSKSRVTGYVQDCKPGTAIK